MLLDHSREDNFESLLEWIEIRVQVMDEAQEETYGLGKNDGKTNNPRERQRTMGYKTRTVVKSCIVDKCNQDHPPWVCPMIKEHTVTKRKELIQKTGRCFQCLAAGYYSKSWTKIRVCGVGGRKSVKHGSYLPDHETGTWQQEESTESFRQNLQRTVDRGRPTISRVESREMGMVNSYVEMHQLSNRGDQMLKPGRERI